MLPTKIVPKAFVLLSLLLGAVGNVPSSLFLEKVVATITLKNDSHIYAKIKSNGKGQNDTLCGYLMTRNISWKYVVLSKV